MKRTKFFPGLGVDPCKKRRSTEPRRLKSMGLMCFILKDRGHMYSWNNPKGLSRKLLRLMRIFSRPETKKNKHSGCQVK